MEFLYIVIDIIQIHDTLYGFDVNDILCTITTTLPIVDIIILLAFFRLVRFIGYKEVLS